MSESEGNFNTELMTSRNSLRSSIRKGPIIFSDFDGTITQTDVTDQILNELAHPSWREVEQEWVRGAIGSRECLERQLALVDATREELDSLIDSVPLDPHFAGFVRFVEDQRIPFYVVSDGFDYVIRRVLRRSGVNGHLRNGTHLFASSLRVEGRHLTPLFPHSEPPCEHGCATCKPLIMRQAGAGHDPIIFIGDGLSDRFAVEAANLVFAKRQLLSYCHEKQIDSIGFETFKDIQMVVERYLANQFSQYRRVTIATH
jgi:2,3-diketo-5-methylthio-1-phosphopentane phosphatase